VPRGEDYYIATSTFEWFPGVRIYHSRDLKNWSLVSTPLDSVALLDMKGNPDSGGIWAPCLSYADGKFWLLYTDVKIVDSPWKNGRNFLVTAPRWRGRGATRFPWATAGSTRRCSTIRTGVNITSIARGGRVITATPITPL
jgi:xylan 1,4-beta-xylosidase